MKKKIVHPAMCEVYTRAGNTDFSRAFATIEFSNDGRLSISGVIGPTSNGNCRGSCGQCVDEIRAGNPADGWTDEMLHKFCDIWDEWHLNDMHPECEHQRALGWKEQASEKITLYHYVLNGESSKKQKEAEREASKALKSGVPFTPTAEQTMFACLSYFLDTYDKIEAEDERAKYYKPYKSCIGTPESETKTRGWVRYGTGNDKSESGILCKPCPVCGYEYGHGWQKVEVPKDIIDWLFSLPDTPVSPAWC